MPNTEMQIRTEMVRVAERLYARNLLAATDGNLSCRLSAERILITPSGLQKGFLKPEQFVTMAISGDALLGQPSGERWMHLFIYQHCPEARYILHAHPPHAVAWSLARPDWTELPSDRLSEVILGAGHIPIAPYARPGTMAMGEVLKPYLPACRALILRAHGAVTWGTSLEEALNGMERIEHSAYILWLAEQLGGSQALPAEEVKALQALRAQMGDKLL